jgi:hypothetical protein
MSLVTRNNQQIYPTAKRHKELTPWARALLEKLTVKGKGKDKVDPVLN